MIASLNGILAQKSMDSVVVDVGGVGYKVAVSLNTFARLPGAGDRVFLFVHTAVREDDIALFGFIEESEKKVFLKLIGVNGIGPKLALTILSGIAPTDLIDALHREDLARLTAISGIGKKTAERMILDLKDKLKELLTEDRLKVPAGPRGLIEEATSALVNLGYNRAVAEKTLSHVPLTEGAPLEQILRKALKILSDKALT
ncbi:MAG TPA: Holliday junction branch migration protein RuvA [bacterium]|nr:Holliday junction branch migration protein RuvA [bacterium]